MRKYINEGAKTSKIEKLYLKVNLLQFGPNGIECPQAGVHIDPWGRVNNALLTHAHADHARHGHRHYLAHSHNREVLRIRLGRNISLQTIEYGQAVHINGVRFSWHPAGHIPGSAQIRVEGAGQVWVVSGDYKTENDGFTPPFEPVSCSHFITECTFGLPVYRWKPQELTARELRNWLQENGDSRHSTILYAYSLGKAQRLIHLLKDRFPLYVHPSIAEINRALAGVGYPIPELPLIGQWKKSDKTPAVFVVPPGAAGAEQTRQPATCREASVSGWTLIRGMRRRQSLDNGFALSDHADWPGLLQAVKSTGAERIYCTHGFTAAFSRYLREQGYHSSEVVTRFFGDAAPDETATIDVSESQPEDTAEASALNPPPTELPAMAADAPSVDASPPRAESTTPHLVPLRQANNHSREEGNTK